MPQEQKPPPDRHPADLAVVDRAALRKISRAVIAAMVIAALAACTVAVIIAFGRISVLEADLRERRAVRDRQAATVQEQQRQGRADLCTALRHLTNPDAPELRDIRDRYHCPGPEAATAPPTAGGAG